MSQGIRKRRRTVRPVLLHTASNAADDCPVGRCTAGWRRSWTAAARPCLQHPRLLADV